MIKIHTINLMFKTQILVISLFIFTLNVTANEQRQDINIGERLSIHSKILDEERLYLVRLPASYDDKTYQPKHYPVLYILDGEAHFLAAAGAIDHMSAGHNGNIQIPELIVVAIPNTTDRVRDLTPSHTTVDMQGEESKYLSTSGGGDKFLQFIEKELIPKIETDYRTIPNRTFVGHSLGGLIVAHSLLSQPGLFQNYIAIDSSLWWDDQIMDKRVQEFITDSVNTRANIYMSLGGHLATGEFAAAEGMLLSNLRFAEWLEKSKSPDLRVKLQQFPEENHGSVPLLSFYHGLLFDFEGYALAMDTCIDGAEAVSDHFAAFSDKTGVEFLPPEYIIDVLGDFLGEYLKPETVQGYLELNVSNYPSSAHAKQRLSDFLEKQNEK